MCIFPYLLPTSLERRILGNYLWVCATGIETKQKTAPHNRQLLRMVYFHCCLAARFQISDIFASPDVSSLLLVSQAVLHSPHSAS